MKVIQLLVVSSILSSSYLAFPIAINPANAAKKLPFTGNWVSSQFTNGKEFNLRLQQTDKDSLIGWEGRLPASSEHIPADIKGTIDGRTADIQIEHRRGYKAHAILELRSGKLVWKLLESDSRASRYFPLASTLNKRDENVANDSAKKSNNGGEQVLWDILAHADSFESGTIGEGGQASAYFNAYKALITRATADDTALRALLETGSAAGKLYAAAILWELNKDAGLAAFKSLQSNGAAVTFKSGCESFPTSVSEVASSFVTNGSYLDFPSKQYRK